MATAHRLVLRSKCKASLIAFSSHFDIVTPNRSAAAMLIAFSINSHVIQMKRIPIVDSVALHTTQQFDAPFQRQSVLSNPT